CLYTQSRFIEALLPRTARCVSSLNSTCIASARAVRPLAAGEPSYRAKASCSIGLGCPSFGGQRTSGSARKTCKGQTKGCVQQPCLRWGQARRACFPQIHSLPRQNPKPNALTNQSRIPHCPVGSPLLARSRAPQLEIGEGCSSA